MREASTLTKSLIQERSAASHRVSWQWVRGHDGHPQNEYANHLATRAAADQSRSGGAVESGFEAWLAAYRAKGGRVTDTAPFPDSAAFKASATLPRVP